MHEAERVRGGERVAERLEDREHLGRRQRAALVDHVAQARTFDVLEDEIRPAVVERAVVERAHDVAMIEPLDRCQLALEPRRARRSIG